MRKFLLLVAVFGCGLQPAGATDPRPVPPGRLPVLPISQTVDPCHKQCAPLLQLDSRSEAKRTYNNCRAMCAGTGTVICPDGSRIRVRPGASMKC